MAELVICGANLVERIDDRDAELRRLDRVVLHILDRIEALDDGMAGRFRTQPQLFHLLDELALRIARGRLGLLVRLGRTAEVEHLALFERRQLLVLLEAVGIDRAESRLHEHIALRSERFAIHLERDLRTLDHRRLRKRGHETACNQVVELVFCRRQHLWCRQVRRMDGRMVGRFRLATRSCELVLLEQLFCERTIHRIARDALQDVAQVER